ncbi:adhesin/invasin [Gammaproteobacteria bacterium]
MANGAFSNLVSITVNSSAIVVNSIVLIAGAQSVVADGISEVILRATVKDINGSPAAGVQVNFSSTAGTLTAISGITDSDGVTKVSLKSSSRAGTATITAIVSGFSATTTVTFVAGSAASVTLVAAPTTIRPSESSTITATVLDANNNLVSGETLGFEITHNASGGSLTVTSATTDGNGRAIVSYTAGSISGIDILKTSLTNGASSSTVNITVDTSAIVVNSIVLIAGAQSVVANGISTVKLRATVKDVDGNPAIGLPVDFSSTAGTLTATSGITDATGVTEVSLKSPTRTGTATITAIVSGFSATATVTFVAGSAASVALAATPTTIRPSGSSTITATVLDANKNSVVGETVSFDVSQNGSGGSFVATSAVTNGNGRAIVSYTGGSIAGIDTLEASLTNGISSSTVSIKVETSAIVVNSVVLVTGAQSVVANGTNEVKLRATVKDIDGNPATGLQVDFSTTAGLLTSSISTTDSSGIAEVTLTAPTKVGTATLVAVVSGFNDTKTITFTAGNATTILLNAAPSTIYPSGSSTVQATVFDVNENLVSNQSVNFSATSNQSGGSFSVVAVTTDGNGRAATFYTAGSVAGTDTISATLASGTSVSTNITVNASATVVNSIVLTMGASSVVADGTSKVKVRATVKDIDGKAAASLAVAFSTTAGALDSISATTDSTGVAEVNLTAPTRIGSATVIASAGGFSSSGNITFVAGAPSFVTVAAAPATLARLSTSVVQVVVQDAQGNAVTGTSVTLAFSTNASGATLSATTGVTNTDGTFSVTYTAGSTGGVSDVITATTTNNKTGQVTLSVNAVSVGSIQVFSAATLIADGAQQTTVRAIVRDLSSNLASGVTVSFSSSNGTLVVASPVTSTDGTATATLKAPTRIGSANLIASAGGAFGNATVQFIAGSPASITLAISPVKIAPTSTTTLTTKVTDATGNAVGSTVVRFSVATNQSQGALTSSTVTTSSDGLATTTYTAGVSGSGSIVTDTLKAEALAADPAVVIPATTDVTVDPSTVTFSSLALAIVNGTVSLTADGTSTVRLRATVQKRTTTGGTAAAPGVTVNFTATSGALSAATAVTDSDGFAEVVLTAPTQTSTATLKATTAGLVATASLSFVAGTPDISNSTLTANPSSLAADGVSTSTVTVVLADVNGNLVADGTSVFLVTTAGTITTTNPTVTASGRASFTLKAPTSPSTTDLSIAQLPTLTTQVQFGSASTGDPASITLSAGTTRIYVAGVGKTENTTISLQIKDDAGNAIDENTYGNTSINNIRVSMLTQPHGGEYVSGVDAAADVCTTLHATLPDLVTCPNSGTTGPIYLRTNNGAITLNLQAGALPGVVEVKVEVLLGSDGTTLSTPLTASMPQVVIASGPPHTIALTSGVTGAITNLGGGIYRRAGKILVTDRYGNNVPDNTVISLGLVDSVLAQGLGNASAGSAVLTSTSSLLGKRCTLPVAGSSSCVTEVFTFNSEMIRNNTMRGIQTNDRVFLEDVQAQDKNRFASTVTSDTTLTVQSEYLGDQTGALYTVGASLLGAEVAGLDSSGNLTVGIATTKDGLADFRVTYPAHNNNSGVSHGTILVGCFGYASNSYSLYDKRYDVPQSTQVYILAASSDDSAIAIDKGQFCFSSISGWTFTPSATSLSSGGTVGLALQDGGDKMTLPFQGVYCYSVVTTRVNGSDFDLSASVSQNPENQLEQTDIDGTTNVTVTLSGVQHKTGDTGVVTCTSGDASATITVIIP